MSHAASGRNASMSLVATVSTMSSSVVQSMVDITDIGHESHWPETGYLAWESNPGPIKKIVLFGRGSNPGPTKNNTIT